MSGLPEWLNAAFRVARGRALAALFASLTLPACVAYAPYPYPGYSAFDRAWSAALNGAQDAGVQVSTADPVTGLIRGTRGDINVTINVARQADGSARVQFDAKGPTGKDPGLADRFSEAYDRRMGR
jgi:hypothetical protein